MAPATVVFVEQNPVNWNAELCLRAGRTVFLFYNGRMTLPARVVFWMLLILPIVVGGQVMSHTAEAQDAGISLIRQADHIVVGAREAEKVFRLFSETLKMPVVWPFRSYGAFASGGVALGNVNLELVRAAEDKGLVAMALEPISLTEAMGELDKRALKRGAAAPFSEKDETGQSHLRWTTIQLPSLAPAFLCKYNFDVTERRVRLKQELDSRQGGPLGIQSVEEVLIGVPDMKAVAHDWSLLLGALQPDTQATWQPGAGPMLRLSSVGENRLLWIRVKVKSLDAARTFLKEMKLAGSEGEHEISLDKAQVGGADIRLTERE